MKPRRVVLTIELESNQLVRDLKDQANYYLGVLFGTKVIQVDANVIQNKKKGK